MRIFKSISILLIIFAMIFTLLLANQTSLSETRELFWSVMDSYSAQTHAENSVTSIYLNFRVFDTIFEALMLLISVIAVIHLSRHDEDHFASHEKSLRLDAHISEKAFIFALIPIVFLIGFYIIFNGHLSPGGGFQGGAVLSTALICVYLVRPAKSIDFGNCSLLEKCTFLIIITLAVCFGVSNVYLDYKQLNVFYLIAMNILIGLKVFLGLSIIFFRFVHYEDQ